jgi:hypothetical protein
MNVSELPSNGGAFVFGQPWGFADLTAVYAGSELTLGACPINDPDPFWYIGGGAPGADGNKIMEALGYAEETGPLAGQLVTFSGMVMSNTFTEHTVVAFVRDFAPDYSSFVGQSVPLNAVGGFSVSLATINDPARHVQYGFATTGVNVWPTDVSLYGNMVIAPDLTVGNESQTWGKIKALYR